jgi:hypothetical protein
VGKYPYLDFESQNKEFLISKDFNYMGYRLIKIGFRVTIFKINGTHGL